MTYNEEAAQIREKLVHVFNSTSGLKDLGPALIALSRLVEKLALEVDKLIPLENTNG